jgi:hypothetical protein
MLASTLSYFATAEKIGTYTLDAATLAVGDGLLPVPSVQLVVRSPSAAALRSGRLPASVQSLHLVLEGLPQDVYVGQVFPVEITLPVPRSVKIRTQGAIPQLIGENFRMGYGSDLPLEKIIALKDISSGEARWRTVLRATTLGDLSVAFVLGASAVERKELPAGGGKNWETFFAVESWIPVALSPVPHRIRALPLPLSGQPSDFCGAIGNFAILESRARRSGGDGTALEITVSLEGCGNFSTLKTPELVLGGGWFLQRSRKIFHPADPLGLSGTVDFSYVLCGGSEKYLPRFSLSFFNPDSAQYERLSKVFPAAIPSSKK